MLDWLAAVADGARHRDRLRGDATRKAAWVGAGEPLVYISGSLAGLSDLETLALQKVGPACVAAHNAYQMCVALPRWPSWRWTRATAPGRRCRT